MGELSSRAMARSEDDEDSATVVARPIRDLVPRDAPIEERSMRGFASPPAAGRHAPALPLPPPAVPRRPMPSAPELPYAPPPPPRAPMPSAPDLAPHAAPSASHPTAPAPLNPASTPPPAFAPSTVLAAPQAPEGIPPFVLQYLLVSGIFTALGLVALIYLML